MLRSLRWFIRVGGAGVVLVSALAVGVLGAAPTSGATGTPNTHHVVSLVDLTGAFSGTTKVFVNSCPILGQDFDATYVGGAAVGAVTFHTDGCFQEVASSFTYTGTFTISTNLGSVSGSVAGPINGAPFYKTFDYEITLAVTSGTGGFTKTRGALHASILAINQPTPAPVTGNLSVVAAPATTTTLSSTPAVAGQTTTLTSTVTSASGNPHGTVTFTDITTGKKMGTVGLKNGVASLNDVFPNPGSQTVRTYYNGNRNWLPSSATLTIAVS